MKRVLSRILIAGGLMLGVSVISPSFAAESAASKPDAAKGSQLYSQGDASRGVTACLTCHGPNGNSSVPANPNLAGLPHEYIYKQLVDFKVKQGAEQPVRRGPEGAPTAMTAIAGPLTEEDMRNLAVYLAQQPLTQRATATRKDLVERGQQIWRAGLPERGVPACAACHGANAAGIPGQYPRLAGQFPSYIEEQLKLFRAGHRANSEVMRDIADRMSDADIQAVSDYAAGLR